VYLIGAAKEDRVFVIGRRSLRQRTLHVPLGIGGTAFALHLQLLGQGFCYEIKGKWKNILRNGNNI